MANEIEFQASESRLIRDDCLATTRFTLTTPVLTSAPGRIYLFGEHQDYLALPVITAALSLRVNLTTWHHGPPGFRLRLPNLDSRIAIAFDGIPLAYENDRDYLRAGVNVLLEAGFTFSRGIEGEVRSTLPMGIGLGSSTALLVAWLSALSQLADQPATLPDHTLAERAYAAEVPAFGGTDGDYDAYAVVLGQVVYGSRGPGGIAPQVLPARLGTFVVVDAREPGEGLNRQSVKLTLLDSIAHIGRVNAAFSLHTATVSELAEYKDQLSKTDYQLLKATLATRELTTEALTLLHTAHFNHARLGQLLTQQHTYLRDAYQLSTPKIDRLLDVALRAGALGGKVNASGGSGSLFVYAPSAPEFVAEAIDRAGGSATVVQVGNGITPAVA